MVAVCQIAVCHEPLRMSEDTNRWNAASRLTTGDYWKGGLAVDLMQEGVQHGRELAEVQESLGRGDLFCIDEEMRPDRARTARVDWF